MIYRTLLFCCLLLAFTACTSSARTPPEPIYPKVLPGDASLNPAIITPHRLRYRKSGMFMVYDVRPVRYGDTNAIQAKIFVNQEYADDVATDTIIFDRKTLAYRARQLGGGADSPYRLEIEVQDHHLTGQLTPGQGSDYQPRSYDKQYPHDAFEPAIINYFIAALPLSEGYRASLPVFDLNDGSQMFWSNIEVLGRETLTIDGHTFDTWKVFSDGIKQKTIWISTNAPYAVQMKTSGNWGAWQIVPDAIHIANDSP
ncbi:MAG: hypothetical protein Tsb002_29780 [Wenzhouxiangellaceae bacterium]